MTELRGIEWCPVLCEVRMYLKHKKRENVFCPLFQSFWDYFKRRLFRFSNWSSQKVFFFLFWMSWRVITTYLYLQTWNICWFLRSSCREIMLVTDYSFHHSRRLHAKSELQNLVHLFTEPYCLRNLVFKIHTYKDFSREDMSLFCDTINSKNSYQIFSVQIYCTKLHNTNRSLMCLPFINQNTVPWVENISFLSTLLIHQITQICTTSLWYPILCRVVLKY